MKINQLRPTAEYSTRSVTFKKLAKMLTVLEGKGFKFIAQLSKGSVLHVHVIYKYHTMSMAINLDSANNITLNKSGTSYRMASIVINRNTATLYSEVDSIPTILPFKF